MFANNLPDKISDQTSFQQSQDKFNYAALTTEARIVAKQRAGEIKSLMQQNSQNIIEIGQKLIDVKEQMDHGQFGKWLKAEFGWSKSAALRFMQVASQFKNTNLVHLEIAPSALYEIAAPSTPEGVRQEIIERAKQGEKITYTKAKSISAQHKPFKLKEAKKVTVDTPAETVEREASNDSFEQPVEAQHTYTRSKAATQTSSESKHTATTEVEPTRYATPPQNLETVEDALNVEADLDEQELAEDQEELRQSVEREEASVHVSAFDFLRQEDQIKRPLLEEGPEEQNSEVLAQPIEIVEVQVIKVTDEVTLEPAIKFTQENDNGENQPTSIPIFNNLTVVTEAEAPQKVVYKIYQFLRAEAMQYVEESPSLKFSKVDEVIKELASSTKFNELFLEEPLNQVQLKEVWNTIDEGIPFEWVFDWLRNHPQLEQQANKIWQVIACYITPDTITNRVSEEQLESPDAIVPVEIPNTSDVDTLPS